MCIQMAELDKAVGRLLAHLDARRIDYVVVLSADHGGSDLPERQVRQALPGAGRVDPASSPRALSAAIAERTGIAAPDGWLVHADGPYGDYYLSGSLGPEQRQRVQAALVGLLAADPQVAAVYTAAQLAAMPLPPPGMPQEWSLAQRARASFDPRRSGDVVALLRPGITPIIKPTLPYTASHGSPWDYDRRVPLLFWRRGLAGLEQPAPVETVDIAPTLTALLGLKVAAGEFDGRCLDIDGGAGDTCKSGQ
jgi:arylsulfatase A-like enzyme